MENLILFDQDTLYYRQSIYRQFRKVFAEKGYNLVVIYDKKLNEIREDRDLFVGIEYTLKNCIAMLRRYDPPMIIQYIWLKYKFLYAFMLYCRVKGIKTLLWSHGINMQSRTGTWKKYLYYVRQLLSTAQIIYTPNELKYVVTRPEKVFVANNTLNYEDLPRIEKSREEIKDEYGFSGKKVLLCVGRLNTHNRKVDLLLDAHELIHDENIVTIIVGNGLTEQQIKRIEICKGACYLGAIFDPLKINEIYKMADVFIMPGGVGLAINHAFYHGLPAIIENVNHSPEAYYLKDGINGFVFNKADPEDLKNKILKVLSNKELHDRMSREALKTVKEEASFERMQEGFVKAIDYMAKL